MSEGVKTAVKRKNTELAESVGCPSKVSRSNSLTAISGSQKSAKQNGRGRSTRPVNLSQPVGGTQPDAIPIATQPVLTGKHSCNLCNDCIQDDHLHNLALQCCLCDMFFHALCCDIDESLLDDLHVVHDVGGWCCLICRSLNKNSNNKTSKVQSLTQKNADNIETIKIELNKLGEHLKSLSRGSTQVVHGVLGGGSSPGTSAPKPSSKSVGGKLYSNVLSPRSIPVSVQNSSQNRVRNSMSGLDNELHTAVLSAVHEEFSSISKRAFNIVVTGMPPSNTGSDTDQFVELCFSMLDIQPHVKSTWRMGEQITGKIQPLLITLESTDEVDNILSIAKNLRQSTSLQVRQFIYFNKHMTKAESLAAFKTREKRRNSRLGKNKIVDFIDTASDQAAGPSTFIVGGMTANIVLPTTLHPDLIALDINTPSSAQTADESSSGMKKN